MSRFAVDENAKGCEHAAQTLDNHLSSHPPREFDPVVRSVFQTGKRSSAASAARTSASFLLLPEPRPSSLPCQVTTASKSLA